ncbi:hypothetical protein SAMN06265222_1011161 [Neorhodopirellula lusitana]|uniref:Uncharacterized protein n=1 Tax=Neorhodopirellula lusitana TaxID=445327 RepID=A0ABY1PS58_9BACT|nr:hypothetical protein SAMN06265222_1011161 [Neorhodopirellula lusitana]
MSTQPTFTLAEDHCFGGQYTWQLQSGQLRFTGDDAFRHFDTFRNTHVTGIDVDDLQLDAFRNALDLLDVWRWRPDYTPMDLGYDIDDGVSWQFTASFADNECSAAGANAFPSFADPLITVASLGAGRYGMLLATFCDTFRVRLPGVNC